MDKRVKENASVVTAAEESARASAESAQETADRFAGSVGAVVQNANAQINASKALVNEAKSEVDATVTTVAQAVQTANNASASAQASAQTVAGYGDRLTAVEDKAQGNSTDIQHLEIETRDLYDRDANNVKLHANYTQVMEGGLDVGNPLITHGTETQKTSMPTSSTTYTERVIKEVYDVNGTRFMRTFLVEQNNTKSVMTGLYGNDGTTKVTINNSVSADGTFYNRQLIKNNHYINVESINDAGRVTQYGSTPDAGAASNTLVNKAYVESTDGVSNNLVHRSANEHVAGIKYMDTGMVGKIGWNMRITSTTKACFCDIPLNSSTSSQQVVMAIYVNSRGGMFFGRVGFVFQPDGTITDLGKAGLLTDNESHTYLYAYRLPGTYTCRLVIGNRDSFNNYVNFNILGGETGAGYPLPIDLTHMGEIVTSEVPADAVSLRICGSE